MILVIVIDVLGIVLVSCVLLDIALAMK